MLRTVHAAAPPPCPPMIDVPPLTYAFNRSGALRPQQLERGVALLGDGSRLRRKLRSGLPVTIAAIGASNVQRGGCQDWQKPTRCAMPDIAGADPKTGLARGWLLQAFQAINRTWPHPRHRLVNSAVGAQHPQSFTTCFNKHVPMDADAVMLGFAEFCRGKNHLAPFTVQSSTNFFQSIETMTRLALSRDDPPAVMLFVHKRFGCGKHQSYCGYEAGCDTMLMQLAQWYRVSLVSLRNAMYLDADAQVVKDTETGVERRNPYFHKFWTIDQGLHFDLGFGDRIAAELVYGWVRRMTERSAPDSGRSLSGVMPRQLSKVAQASFSHSICFDFADKRMDGTNRTQWDAFHRAPEPVVRRSDGWVQVGWDDGMTNGQLTRKWKPGMKALDRDATLEVDTTQAGRGRVRVGYLQTYSSHAKARLTCLAPCACASSILKANTATRTSTIKFSSWVNFSSTQPCVLRLQLETHNESFKFSALQVVSGDAEIRKDANVQEPVEDGE